MAQIRGGDTCNCRCRSPIDSRPSRAIEQKSLVRSIDGIEVITASRTELRIGVSA